MKKTKIFNAANTDELESSLNEWLAENPSIQITNVSYSFMETLKPSDMGNMQQRVFIFSALLLYENEVACILQ